MRYNVYWINNSLAFTQIQIWYRSSEYQGVNNSFIYLECLAWSFFLNLDQTRTLLYLGKLILLKQIYNIFGYEDRKEMKFPAKDFDPKYVRTLSPI